MFSTEVINVFPKITITDSNSEVFASFTDWKIIEYDGHNEDYNISVKLVDDDKLAVKIYYKQHELRFEPSRLPSIIETE